MPSRPRSTIRDGRVRPPTAAHRAAAGAREGDEGCTNYRERVHVERFESALWQTASLALLADGEAVLIDPGIADTEIAALRARVDALGARVTHVLATHGDWDHVCGIAAFPDATAAMGPLTAERVTAGGSVARVVEAARRHGVEVVGPPRADAVLSVGTAQRIGPFDVETMALPGHTPDGVGYRVRALDLLAVGDHLSAVEFPFVTSSAGYRATLAGLIDVLRHDPPATVVPGHGPALTAPQALEIAEADLAYLRALRAAVAAALRSGAGRERARAAALAVEPPRQASDDLAVMREANVDAQLAELLPAGDR
jgi:hydroxyacylglutathione hydrolase